MNDTSDAPCRQSLILINALSNYCHLGNGHNMLNRKKILQKAKIQYLGVGWT